jgi:uncharacterized FAD-dependent dehydrogenase
VHERHEQFAPLVAVRKRGLVVTVDPDRDAGPFAGVELQQPLERRFYEAGGGGFRAPAQRAADFLAGRESGARARPSYKLGLAPARIDALLPSGSATRCAMR